MDKPSLFPYAPWNKNLIHETTLEPGTRRVLNRYRPVFEALFNGYSHVAMKKGMATLNQVASLLFYTC